MPGSSQWLGHAGELAAASFFVERGYTVARRNYRHRRAEVDLIVQYGNSLLVFVEVKARSCARFGHPEEFVTERKRQLFRLAADQYQAETDWQGDIRFDILALTQVTTGFRIVHFEDAFF